MKVITVQLIDIVVKVEYGDHIVIFIEWNVYEKRRVRTIIIWLL